MGDLGTRLAQINSPHSFSLCGWAKFLLTKRETKMEPDLIYKVLLRSPFCARWKRWGRVMPGAPGYTCQRGLKIYNCRGRSPRLRGLYQSWILYAILGIIHTACGNGDVGKCYGWCGGQSQCPRVNCYLRQLPSTFIRKSADDATN